MTDPTSRYASLDVVTATVPDGTGGSREVRCLSRRLLPMPGSAHTLTEHTVAPGDRPDTIAAAGLGDPAQFWRICDAHRVIHPDELTAADRIGTRIRIPFPLP
ncbi:LysM domain-containing protein [Streptomyces scabiei]|uniref:LysM domain-containing protein n=1 Tax=Streptomyces scabiei TaxID=1930 RepID=UPI0036966289